MKNPCTGCPFGPNRINHWGRDTLNEKEECIGHKQFILDLQSDGVVETRKALNFEF